MVAQSGPEWDLLAGDEMVDPLSISCNLTCCKYSDDDDDIICFSDLNFTEYKNLTIWAPWELAVRWTFASLIMLVAVLGNLTIIIILAKNRLLLRTSVNHFILNMSVADLILALTGPIPFTVRDTSMFWPLGEAWCYLEGYIQMLVMLVSLESLATISCDRMMGVVRPFHTHLKTWQSLAIIIIIWVSSAVLAVPWGLYRVYTIHIWKDRTETNCGEKETLYMWWMALVGLAWLSLAIMLVSYFTILAYFRHPSFKNFSKREHPVMTHLKKRVVKMMFLVVVTFVVCWLPIQLLNIFHTNFLNDFGSLKDDTSKRNYAALMTVSQYMIYVNPAVNPVIYGLLHQNFRRAFRLTFPCIFTRKSTLVLTRGQGVTRYMWSVKSTGSQPSVTGQRRHCGERQVQPERNPATPSRRLSGSETLNDEAQRNSHVSSEGERKRRKKCCILKPGRLARQKSKKKDRWSPENDNDERCCSAGSSYANEKYVRDLPQKISIVSKGALGHLITEVIEEETSSDAERERVL
ncbi:substance-K receptor-like isoform X2 [Scylla paramamosain]|uniref:substance-K receptor-like isoform X2 n=1 Tax=Scylla paramamosain TaxID=85552 RepID=UPI0030827A62